ncbi:ETC complex I subunit conserved region [Monaibacterium marinum]|uniref:ETC complex I subunit conserved region n=1 Tax=Pontivivens marinum TaxID=1690039 RepID=A0A2C9CNG1_9RHOB|nr:ETC complex I subunit [Monaibacterium marinum]SOH92854.1 ETC complex I subunit conserved region [Monaibacterium marinum]
MLARIYQPAKTAMSSGTANSQHWVLQFEAAEAKRIDPLMGWQGSGDTTGQVHLRFDTRAAAIEYARRHGIPHQVMEPKPRKPNVRNRGYGDNFAHDRRGAWTH